MLAGTWLALMLADDDDPQSAVAVGALSVFTLPEFNDALNLLAPNWCRCHELSRRDCLYTDWCNVWYVRRTLRSVNASPTHPSLAPLPEHTFLHRFMRALISFFQALTFQRSPEEFQL